MLFKQACTVMMAGYWGKMEQIVCSYGYPSVHDGLNLARRGFLCFGPTGKSSFCGHRNSFIIDSLVGQYGWILAKFLSFVFCFNSAWSTNKGFIELIFLSACSSCFQLILILIFRFGVILGRKIGRKD